MKNVISTWGRGEEVFIMFLVIDQSNDTLQQKKLITTFVLWDAPQLLIKLINIHYKKYLHSCKSLGQK
jgi:hypothetical protein